VGREWQVLQSFRTPFGDEFAGSLSLLQHAFERGWRHGGERLSRCHVAWIWEALFHAVMMRKFWCSPRWNLRKEGVDFAEAATDSMTNVDF
jgi:hypothetical protein